MIKKNIIKVIEKNDLNFDESHFIMSAIMEGKLNNSQIAALLIALKSKGETPEEVAGFAKAMREKGSKIEVTDMRTMDVCGTGGDNSNTFNISTAVSFVVAAAGIPVAKHGNRSISSKSGSADVLKALGVNIELSAEQSEKALNELGITFLFAPIYHPAMKYAAPVRRELGFKTIFNILGPLTNPAQTKVQMIGVFNDKAAKLMADSSEYLGMKNVCFICTENKYDEITLAGITKVIQRSESKGTKTFNVSPDTFGTPSYSLEDIKGKEPEYNAEIIRNLFAGKINSAALDVVSANAALALFTAEYSHNIKECFMAAKDIIKSGKAEKKLNELIEFGN